MYRYFQKLRSLHFVTIYGFHKVGIFTTTYSAIIFSLKIHTVRSLVYYSISAYSNNSTVTYSTFNNCAFYIFPSVAKYFLLNFYFYLCVLIAQS